MARRLGIILATTVVALLVMSDGAWACRCMNRLINRCGDRWACCCDCVQPACCCCQPVVISDCCQPATGAVQVEVKAVSPPANDPVVAPQGPTLVVPVAPQPAPQPEPKPEIKPEPKVEPVPPPKPGPVEVPAEPRVPAKPEIKPVEPVEQPQPAKKPEAPVAPKPPEPAKTPDKAPDLVAPVPVAPDKAPEPAAPVPATAPAAPDKAPVPAVPDKAPVPAVPDKAPAPVAPDKAPEPAAPDKAPKPPAKDDPFGAGSNDVKTLRMWTDASGKYQIEARFVSFQDGTVRLQKANGRYVRIAYDFLCSGDQDFVLNQDRSLFAVQ